MPCFGVDHRHHRVQAVVLGDVVVHEEGLAHRAGVGHAGGLDDDALERQVARFAPGAQVRQRAHQVDAHGAADTAVGQLDDFFVAILHQQVVVDALGPEFVLDHRHAPAVVFGQDALEQGGLARTEKAGEDRDGNHFVQTARGVHGRSESKGRVAQAAARMLKLRGAAIRGRTQDYSTDGARGKPGATLARGPKIRPGAPLLRHRLSMQ